MMYEVIRWSSIVLLWIATGMNIYAFIRGTRNYKALKESQARYEQAVKETWLARDRYYDIIEKFRKEHNNEADAL